MSPRVKDWLQLPIFLAMGIGIAMAGVFVFTIIILFMVKGMEVLESIGIGQPLNLGISFGVVLGTLLGSAIFFDWMDKQEAKRNLDPK